MGFDAGNRCIYFQIYLFIERNLIKTHLCALLQKPHPAELVDQASRGLFPLGFAICNVAYWVYYLYLADQDLAKMQNDNNDVHGYE